MLLESFNNTENRPLCLVVHGEVSVGVDGIGAVIGFDIGDTSYDFEITGGWKLIAIFVASQYYQPNEQYDTAHAF